MTKSNKHKKDLQLFDRIKQGDKKSFEALFSLYYDALCNFAYLFVQNHEVSEEVVSDVFVNIWHKKERINIHLNVKSYLYKSTKNAVLSYTRKQKLDTVNIEGYQDTINAETPETLLLKVEKTNHLYHIINKLPKKAGLVFRMHKVDQMKYREIAEVLGISEKTVENHMGNSIRHLRDMANRNPEMISSLISLLLLGFELQGFIC